MIEIVTKKGEVYSYDESTQRLFKDNRYIPRTEIEPVYSDNGQDKEPVFSGLYIKSSNSIITLTGNIKPVVDINSIK